MTAGDFTGSLQVLEKGPNARIFVSKLGRFAQADTIVPGYTNPQNLNRFAYVGNNPLNYIDPSGHDGQCAIWLDNQCAVYQMAGGTKVGRDYSDTPAGGSGGDLSAEDKVDEHVNVWDPENTNASDEIEEFIREQEGYENSPYNDHSDPLKATCTVGIGHILHYGPCTEAEMNIYYSDEQIEAWFQVDLANAEYYVRAMFQTLDNEYRPESAGYGPGNPVPITQAQFDALVSFTFNQGSGNLTKLVRLSAQPIYGSEEGTFDLGTFAHLMRTVFSSSGPDLGGIPLRREAELQLFLTGEYP